MARRYTSEEKRQALAALAQAGGSYRHAADATGVPARTLRQWEQEATEADSERVLADVRHRLIENVVRLADSLEAKIDDAPLNQHASALAQLIDRLMKLAEKLPQAAPENKIRQVEYIYPDGSTHHTPPWAKNDSDR